MAYEKVVQQNIWLPEKEKEELEGTVQSVKEGNYGKQWTIKQKSGDTINTPSHKVLQNRMESVQVGDKVKIIYMGSQPPKVRGQNPMTVYDVYVDK